MRQRVVYILIALAVIAMGIASRKFGSELPAFIATYAGDTLWAMVVFLMHSAAAPRLPVWMRAGLALLAAFCVEISQLYHAPWIDSIRNTTPGSLVLGHGFLWSDLVCYTAGIAIAAAIEFVVVRFKTKAES